MSNPKSIVGAQKRADTDALASELAALSEVDAVALRSEWRRLYRSEPLKRLSRDLLELGVAWPVRRVGADHDHEGGSGESAQGHPETGRTPRARMELISKQFPFALSLLLQFQAQRYIAICR